MFTNARRWFQRVSPRPNRPAPRRPRRLGVELLEDRLVPAVIDVLGVADNNNAVLTAGHAGTAADPFLAPSLRSAITFANANPGGNTINLTAGGIYKTTLAGTAGETDNLAGEFAILPGGGDLTIQNTSGFAVAIDGNHLNRVFDINPNFNPASPTAKFTVTLAGLTVRNGFATDPNNLDGPNASGGGVRDVGNANLTLNNDVITNNAATADGGGVAMENTVSVPWTLTVNASVISGNHAGDAGGGIDTDGSGKVFINAGTVITGNSAVNQGGGVWLDAISGVVTGVTVNNPGRFGYPSPPAVVFTSVDGQGKRAQGVGTLDGLGMLTGVTITNAGSGYDQPPTVSVPGVGVLNGNPGQSLTATIAVFQGATLNVTGATISNNFAGGVGGGIGNAGTGAVTITDSTLSGNISLMVGGGFGDENALGTLTVSGSVFVGNSATAGGGGVSENGPSATISNSTFRDNLGGNGGAVFADAGTALSLVGDLFAQNTGYFGGGAVQAMGATTNITNSEFLDNFAGPQGGGGLLVVGTTFTGLSLTFADNTSSGNGGAIELQSAGAGATQSFLTNSTLTGNMALNANGGTRGGAIDMSLTTSGDLVLINDTLNGNYAGTGGGLFWAGKTRGSAIFENTIVAGNFAAVGPDVDNPAGFLTDLGGNLIGNPSGSIGFIKGGTSRFGVDPLLGPLQNNGGPTVGGSGDTMTLETEALLPGSPAIGKGLNTFTAGTDERGLLRQFIALNTGPDIGAFETRAVTPSVASTVPGNGDVNPYGVFFVPANFPAGGKLQPGDLLVSNFNNAGNTQGTGTTIVKITPGGQPTTFFTSTQLGLDDALAVLQAGFVVVGNVPNVDGMGTPGPGSLQFIDKNGNLVKTLTDPNLLNGPWGLAVNDQGSTVQLFVSNVNSGTITRINLLIQNGTITVTGMTQIASGYTHRTDPNAFVIGPAGLAYDAAHNVLYVASQGENAIYKIANAGTATTDGGTGTKVVNDPQHLHGPLGLVLTPGGNLIVANSDGVNADPNQPSELVEYTFSNGNINFGGQFSVDPANGGAFGLGLRTTAQGGVKLAAVNDNATTISTWDFEPGFVTGQVFQDHNGDGQFNGSDAGLSGVMVNLLGPGGGVLATTTTDANGNYSFFNVAAGNYQVGVTPPNSSVLTTKTAGVTVGSTAVTAAPLGLYGFAALTGTTLTITGTAGADTVVISLGANDAVNFDGGTYSVSAAAVSAIDYVGNGGADTVYVIDPAAGDVANLFPNSGVLQGAGYTVNVSGVTTLVVVGGATGRAYLHDSPGNDVFLATPAYAILRGPGYFNQVNGFGVALAAAGAGGTDYAYLYDAPGNDVFVGTPGYAYLYGSGFFNQANGFTAVTGLSTAGGTDYAYLYDSPGNDVFVGTPAYSYLYGSGFFNQVDGFKAVTANSSAGGFDQAFLYGSPGNDVFVGMPTTSYLYGSGFWNQVNGFQAVHATGGGGHDVAYLYGAPTGDDSLSAQGNAAALSGPGYSLGVDSFAQVVASVTGTGKHHKQVGAIDYIFTAMGDFS